MDQELQSDLKIKRICRFCLCQNATKLSSIYMRDTRIKTSAPLPIQIMAIASIEVFTNDGMPSYICTDCTQYFECSYQFKQMCKKADNLLRQYPLTGKLASELEKPLLPNAVEKSSVLQTDKKTIVTMTPKSKPYDGRSPSQAVRMRTQYQRPLKVVKSDGDSISNDQSLQSSSLNAHVTPMKILNTNLSIKTELPKQIQPKIENLNDEAATIFLNKIENDDELLIDDVQRLVACVQEEEAMEETEFVNMNSLPVVVLNPTNTNIKPNHGNITNTTSVTKPKLLNKSHVRILNKEAGKNVEPRLSVPKVKHDDEGNVEIFAEILDSDEPYEDEPDPKDAVPVEINIFPCPHCERSFPLRQLRDIHVKNHKRERKFTCDACDKSFFSKYDMQKHRLTHSEEKPFKCSACDKSFARGTLLYRHERTHTDLPKYICVHCERPFLSSEDLNKHEVRHTKRRPFQCKLCHKAFAFKQGLERHEVVHSRQQPFSCQYCDQSFSTTSKLARHLTAHAGDRPYPCKVCAKSYLLSHHLTRHMRSHKYPNTNSSIAFNCNICNETFSSRESLISHSAKHATDDNLVCPLCKECFSNLEDVTNHIQLHSEGEAYACEFCDLIFRSSDKLNKHIEADHTHDMIPYHENDKKHKNELKIRERQKGTLKSQTQEEVKRQSRDEVNDNDDLQDAVDSFLDDDVNDVILIENKIEKTPQQQTSGTIRKSPKVSQQLSSCSKDNDIKANKRCTNGNSSEEVPPKLHKEEKSFHRKTTETSPVGKLKSDSRELPIDAPIKKFKQEYTDV